MKKMNKKIVMNVMLISIGVVMMEAVEVGIVSWNYPSSKKCSCCGSIKKSLKLSDRIYVCDSCNLVIDRDFNASINIRDCKDYELVTR